MIDLMCPFCGDGLVEIIFNFVRVYFVVWISSRGGRWLYFGLLMQVFATPETLIGFHPDAGASFYLSHLPGYLGLFLHCLVFQFSMHYQLILFRPVNRNTIHKVFLVL